MMKTWFNFALVMIAIGPVACGGSTTDESNPSGATNPGAQRGTATADGARHDDTSSAEDEGPSSSDPCSILHPGRAKTLPDGVVVPAAAALRIKLTLENQRINVTSIGAMGVVPAWASKDTQIFSPDTTTGFWVETRDAAGSLTYQRNLFDPLGRTREAAPNPDNPNEGWKNVEQCSTTATFTVEIPGDAAEVRVYGNEKSGAPTALLAWYRLH